jgi:hypothetical protein
MKLTTLLLLASLILLAGCETEREISDFTSDGCSLFPDRSLISEDDWCDCCLEHDIAYWMGGTEEERLAADIALRECVFEKTGNSELAELMFDGVRVGGSPYFYNWYRWGYGWDYGRKYQPLTPDERAMAEKKLRAWFAGHAGNPCAEPDAGVKGAFGRRGGLKGRDNFCVYFCVYTGGCPFCPPTTRHMP